MWDILVFYWLWSLNSMVFFLLTISDVINGLTQKIIVNYIYIYIYIFSFCSLLMTKNQKETRLFLTSILGAILACYQIFLFFPWLISGLICASLGFCCIIDIIWLNCWFISSRIDVMLILSSLFHFQAPFLWYTHYPNILGVHI